MSLCRGFARLLSVENAAVAEFLKALGPGR